MSKRPCVSIYIVTNIPSITIALTSLVSNSWTGTCVDDTPRHHIIGNGLYIVRKNTHTHTRSWHDYTPWFETQSIDQTQPINIWHNQLEQIIMNTLSWRCHLPWKLQCEWIQQQTLWRWMTKRSHIRFRLVHHQRGIEFSTNPPVTIIAPVHQAVAVPIDDTAMKIIRPDTVGRMLYECCDANKRRLWKPTNVETHKSKHDVSS